MNLTQVSRSSRDSCSAAVTASGARFYKCALQVNTYEYLARNGKANGFGSERQYNRAILKACL